MQMDPVVRARRAALRETLTWLLTRAREMNDPHARQILNSAAFDWGNEKLRGFDPSADKAALSKMEQIDALSAQTEAGGNSGE
jgi:hypothetical protein